MDYFSHAFLSSLIIAVCLLGSVGPLYNLIEWKWTKPNSICKKVLGGVLIGIISLGLMLTPWESMPGYYLDARSILIFMAALFFGLVPVAVSVALSIPFGFYLGGSLAWMQMLGMGLAALLGLAWRYLPGKRQRTGTVIGFYLFNVVVQIIVLLCAFILPFSVALDLVKSAAVPFVLVYPVAGILMGFLLNQQMKDRKEKDDVQENENKLRNLIDLSDDAIVMTDEEGKITEWNRGAVELFSIEKENVLGKLIWEVQGSLVPANRRSPQYLEKLKNTIQISLTSGQGDMLNRTLEMPIEIPGKKPRVIQSVAYVIVTEKGNRLCSISRDVTEQKQLEQALRESEAQVRLKLENILLPEGDFGEFELSDIIDPKAVQEIMDDFYELTHMPFAMLDVKGKILIATGWQDICTIFHRVHPEAAKNCLESDTALTTNVKAGDFRLYRCKNNMWDMVTPIIVNGKLAGNLFIGQFIFEDEMVDQEVFRAQAQRYGFDESVYLDALKRVPRFNREIVNIFMRFYARFAQLISNQGHSNIRLARSMAEQERLIEKLQESETRYRQLFEAVSDALLLIDFETMRILEANSAAEKLYQYSREEIQTMQIIDLSAEPEQTRQVFVFPVSYNKVIQIPLRYHHRRDGTIFPVEITGRFFEMEGRPVHIATIRDITKRKRAEEALLESEERFRLAMEATAEGLWDWDIATNKGYFSPGFTRMLGYEPGKLNVTPQKWMDIIYQDDVMQVVDRLKGCIEGEETQFDLEFRMVMKSGENKWVLGSGMVVNRDENGAAMRMIGTLQDISERKKIELAMVESEKLAGIGTLAAGIAHEINTPLQIVTGVSESLRRDLQKTNSISPEILEEKLGNINRNSWRIAAIVRSLLDYAHSTTEQISGVNINDIIKTTLLLLGHQFKSWSNIDISTDLAENLPTLTCDPNKITQALINLLNNARDAMPSGGWITIQTEYDPVVEEIIIRIKDTGTGIPDEIRTKIFDPFFTTKPVGSGTGLGLSITSSIVRAHGGELQLERTSSKGSIFKITLPVKSSLSVANGPVGRYQ